jgi:hypothetical protein
VNADGVIELLPQQIHELSRLLDTVHEYDALVKGQRI